MDSYRGYATQNERADTGPHSDDDIGREPPPACVGQDERRMQVRAYNHWASLLGHRHFPQIEDLAAVPVPDFAEYAVVLDFSGGTADPAVAMLGAKLAQECGATTTIARLSDVPGRSLLSRITEHYMQILANAAPIGFEAEFVDQQGKTLLYRGILLPFSNDGTTIQHVMGVINWKELADPVITAQLVREFAGAVGAGHAPSGDSRFATWADGPVAEEHGALPDPGSALGIAELADGLALARESATVAGAMQDRSRAALYAAIGRTWDFALVALADPPAFRKMAADAGLTMQARAPLTPVAKLVFGTGYDKSRLAEVVAALAHAQRLGLGCGALAAFLADAPGGLRGVVRAERRLRRLESTGLVMRRDTAVPIF